MALGAVDPISSWVDSTSSATTVSFPARIWISKWRDPWCIPWRSPISGRITTRSSKHSFRSAAIDDDPDDPGLSLMRPSTHHRIFDHFNHLLVWFMRLFFFLQRNRPVTARIPCRGTSVGIVLLETRWKSGPRSVTATTSIQWNYTWTTAWIKLEPPWISTSTSNPFIYPLLLSIDPWDLFGSIHGFDWLKLDHLDRMMNLWWWRIDFLAEWWTCEASSRERWIVPADAATPASSSAGTPIATRSRRWSSARSWNRHWWTPTTGTPWSSSTILELSLNAIWPLWLNVTVPSFPSFRLVIN